MARITLSAYKASCRNGVLTVALSIGDEPPFPRRTVEIKRAADAEAEFAKYKAEATATGLPLAISMRIVKGDRSPPGFKNLHGASGWTSVNT